MSTRAQIIAEARSWIGTPYQHQARIKGLAVDCIGFVGGVALACGLAGAAEWNADPTLHSYGRAPDPVQLFAAVHRFLDPVELALALPGDVLLLRFTQEPAHFALLTALDPRYMVHAYARSKFGVTEHRVDGMWARRLIGAYRFRGIE